MLYNFHYPKIMVHVGSSLAKETVLSKVINMVDGFFVNMSQGFDDRQKKYIDTILKLDNSKTILLETKGGGVVVKNASSLERSVGDKVHAEYSEYWDDEGDILFLDFVGMSRIPVDTVLMIGQARLRVAITSEEGIELVVEQSGKTKKDQLVHFENRDPQLDYLHQKDKRDIQRGFEGGVNMLVSSYASGASDINETKGFLAEHDSTKKVIAKIENQRGLNGFEELVSSADGLIFSRSKLLKYTTDEDIIKKISYAKDFGVPVYVLLDHQGDVIEKKDKHKALWEQWISLGVDAFILDETMIESADPLETIVSLYEYLSEISFDAPTKSIKPFYEESSRDVIDYILYNVSGVMGDIPVKAVICYTTTGYTPARLASFRPNIPVIAFTKSDNTYRYINTLWGVKGYKVSQSFTYEKLKSVGKEMIRMMFKGSISLDEKILLVQVNEHDADDVHQINGMELYKFKNM